MPFSVLIRIFQGWTPYSHCALRVVVGYYDNLELHYEATGKNTAPVYRPRFYAKNLVVARYKILVPKDLHKRGMREIFVRMGEKYPFLENIGIALAKLLKLKKNPFKKQGVKCSELISIYLQSIGKESVKFEKDLELIDVLDVEDILKELCVKYPDLVQKEFEWRPTTRF